MTRTLLILALAGTAATAAAAQDRTMPAGSPLGGPVVLPQTALPQATPPSDLELLFRQQRLRAARARALAQSQQRRTPDATLPQQAAVTQPPHDVNVPDSAAPVSSGLYGRVVTPWGNGGIRPAWSGR